MKTRCKGWKLCGALCRHKQYHEHGSGCEITCGIGRGLPGASCHHRPPAESVHLRKMEILLEKQRDELTDRYFLG